MMSAANPHKKAKRTRAWLQAAALGSMIVCGLLFVVIAAESPTTSAEPANAPARVERALGPPAVPAGGTGGGQPLEDWAQLVRLQSNVPTRPVQPSVPDGLTETAAR